MLHVRPLSLAEANSLVLSLHRHHKPVVGHRFSLGIYDEEGICHGAAIVGRPVARKTCQKTIAEVTRLVTDGTPNACSALYGAAARVAKEMGFYKIQTFILDSEPGTSLKAAGWTLDGHTIGGAWTGTPSRGKRQHDHPIEPKQRWIRNLSSRGG